MEQLGSDSILNALILLSVAKALSRNLVKRIFSDLKILQLQEFQLEISPAEIGWIETLLKTSKPLITCPVHN
jgi:hypothetical protein